MHRSVVVIFALAACSPKPRGAKPVEPLAAHADAAVWVRSYPPGSGRPQEVACTEARPVGTGGQWAGMCKVDDDCKTGKNGRCSTTGSRMPQATCTYDLCFHDADCKTGGPCECNATGGSRCLAGNCRTDADCKGSVCGRSNVVSCEGGDASYYCRTAQDTCLTYDDCNPPNQPQRGAQCVFQPALGHWACQDYPDCPVG